MRASSSSLADGLSSEIARSCTPWTSVSRYWTTTTPTPGRTNSPSIVGFTPNSWRRWWVTGTSPASLPEFGPHWKGLSAYVETLELQMGRPGADYQINIASFCNKGRHRSVASVEILHEVCYQLGYDVLTPYHEHLKSCLCTDCAIGPSTTKICRGQEERVVCKSTRLLDQF